jgi:hypothetical protein
MTKRIINSPMPNSRLNTLLKKEMSRKDFLSFTALAVVSLFGVTGVITELLSHAATPYASDEAEGGVLSGAATESADSTASGGKAVQFGSNPANGSGNNVGSQAILADKVVDFFGVTTHMTFTTSAYNNKALVTAIIQDMGIRHIRDGWPNDWPPLVTWLESMNADSHSLSMSWFVDPVTCKQTPTSIVAYIESSGLAPYVSFIEGPNEWDSNDNAMGGGYTRNISSMSAVMQEIHTARNTYGLTSIPILGPSFAHSFETPSTDQEVVGNLTAYIDYGNCHDYRGTQESDTSRQAAVITAAQYVCGSKPLVTTESGWNSVVTANVPGNPAITDESTLGIDLVRSHFMRFIDPHWNQSGPGSFVYELIDNAAGDTNGWGLCTNNGSTSGATFNGSNVASFYKEHALSVKSMIALLTDLGASFTPGKLDYTLTGTQTNMQSVLLQKSNGSFWLCLWEVNMNLWNANNSVGGQGSDVVPAPLRNDLILSFGSGAASNVSQYLPTTGGTTAVSTASNVQSTTVSYGPEVNLVKITL